MASGDTAAPAAFKNVPRRQRSAARPSNDQELGADDSPGRGGSCSPAPPPPEPARGDDGPTDVAPPPACNKKRLSPDCGDPEQLVHHQAEKRHRQLPAEQDAKNGGGGVTPAKAEAAAASASASTTSAKRHVDWAEKERIRKGKTPASNASPPQITASHDELHPVESGGGKLLGDAIRSYAATGAFEIKPLRISKSKPKSKKRKDHLGPPFWCGMGKDGQSTSAAGSDLNFSFPNLGGVVSAALRSTLAHLAAGDPPSRVYGRMLSACDRSKHQSRMQMSCKSWLRAGAGRGEFPLCAFLTEDEKAAAHGDGLAVKAYDRRGVVYDITVRYLDSNRSYRLTHGWGRFLENNGLVVAVLPGPKDVLVDLWLFRMLGGKVGMVIMHYFKGDAAHADAAFDEQSLEEESGCALPGEADGTKAVEEKEAASAPKEEEEAAKPAAEEETGCAGKAVDKKGGAGPREEVTRLSPPDAGGGGKAASGAAALSLRFGLKEYEVSAAHALVQLSTDYGAFVTSTCV